MPGKKHMAGRTEKENRQYEHIKESAKDSGKSEKRSKQIAAATVNKQHSEAGHKKHGS